MTFISRLLGSIPITAAPETQPEAPTPPETQPSFGVAGSVDSFETAALNNFELQQQPQNFSLFQPPATNEMTVEASSVFGYVDVSTPQQPDRLGELSQRLEMLKTKKAELAMQLQGTEEKKVQLDNVSKAIDESLKNDEPISKEVATVLQELGALGVIGGVLTGLPIISAIGGLVGGLSTAYKEKLRQAQIEIDRQKAENNENTEAIQSKADELNQEEESIVRLMEEEKRRLEQ
ncbi:MAG TPA: hypothetical protein VLH08_11500, partial [Acidobacteriota bacterium]|nr:hypothetical protein [Acidobacteriota bacterium]